MAFPTVAASTGGNSGANTTSHTVNLPSGIAAGELIVVLFSTDGAAGTITWPDAGWLSLVAATNLQACTFEVRYRIATGAEGSTISVTTANSEGSAHCSYRVQSHNSSTNAPTIGTTANGASTTPNPPQSNPGSTKDYLWLAVGGHDGNVAVSAAPTNYTNLLEHRWANSNGSGAFCALRNLNASSEDPGTFTMGSDGWIVNTIAIHPGSEGAPEANGTLATTLGAATLAGTATVDVVVTLGTTLGAATLVGTATVDVSATLAMTLDAATLAATGTVEGSGANASLDVTLGAATLAATAAVDVAGTLGTTLGAVSLAGTAAVDVAATLATTLGAVSLAGTAAVDVAGSLDVTLGAATLAGTAAVDVAGSLATTLGALTAAATAAVDVAGTLATTLGAVSLVAEGIVGSATTAMLDVTLGELTAAAMAAVDVAGTLATTLGAATLAATATVDVVGSLDVTLGAATLAATATVDVVGSLATTLGAATLAGTGTVEDAGDGITATLGVTLDAMFMHAVAHHCIPGRWGSGSSPAAYPVPTSPARFPHVP